VWYKVEAEVLVLKRLVNVSVKYVYIHRKNVYVCVIKVPICVDRLYMLSYRLSYKLAPTESR